MCLSGMRGEGVWTQSRVLRFSAADAKCAVGPVHGLHGHARVCIAGQRGIGGWRASGSRYSRQVGASSEP